MHDVAENPRPRLKPFWLTSLDLEPAASPPAVCLKTLLEQTVSLVFEVELEEMQLPTRGRAPVAVARQVAMYLAHVACGLSLTEAGELFSRDRTTVAHACQVVEDRREEPAFDRALELLEYIVKVLNIPALEAA
jgi:chromosomal replication initiation ATPase DnaA